MLNVRPVRNIPTFVACIALAACSVYTPSLLESGPVEADDGLSEPGTNTDDTPSDPAPAPTTKPTTTGSSPTATQSSSGPSPAVSTAGPLPDRPVPPGETSAPPATSAPAASGDPTPVPPSGTVGPAVPAPSDTGTTTPTPSTDPTEPPAPTSEGPAEEVPSDDPLVDDFEDGTEQLRLEGSREGFWFARGNATDDGTITDIGDAFVELADGDNLVALHIVAENFIATDTWAVFGANFNNDDPAPAYIQAAQYDGLHFWACGGLGASKVALEVATTDTSSAYDGQDNHYRLDLSLTASWKEFIVPWDDLKQSWGDMSTFNAERVLGIQFNISTGEEGFDVWLDDVEFIDPSGTTVTTPRSGECPSSAPPEPEPAADAGAG
jgi:Carbohydrate binding domain (family 11)